ncbi:MULTISPECIES: phage regulatory CII family protein [Klebsiella]|uniref:Phage regulatory CII family protein n=1 Tax=Klebsiella variicola TaxID=244366 RepID=A0A7H0ENP1_KLEVA|nr:MULTISPECIES: phage regulatory CII family protein [Enterobacteriaceae]EKW2603134.1 phage regulatory CII family protein [Klebsiella quasipneumoniae]MCJ5285552.1 phage regulatory CII family protein [Klebsiella variicola]MCJ5307348.1 phage regulatory CII family protein [Klebsiella variicola]MCZ7739451.1 phage regulatory CII family protein [Klebsiella pneumoniae]MDZ3703824.1 phage regulatory CII family protein [Klebsiella variicola]
MLDFRVSSHTHFDDACRKFAASHNVKELAVKAGIKPHTLYNKLNPEQPHQLTPREIWVLTDLTEDSTLVDGFLAQIHCLPCVPVNELAKDKLQSYVMHAMSELGQLASGTVTDERLTPARKQNMIASVNSGIRMLSLSALALQARLQANPAMSSVVDTMTGIGATFGLV